MRQNVQHVRAAVGPLKKMPMGAYSSKAKVYALGGAIAQVSNLDDEAALHLAKKYLQEAPAETPVAEVLSDARDMFGAAEDLPEVDPEEIAGGSAIGDFLRNAASRAVDYAKMAVQHAKPAAKAAASYALDAAKRIAEDAVRQRLAAQMAASEAAASAEKAAAAAAEAADEPATLAELIRRDTSMAKAPAKKAAASKAPAKKAAASTAKAPAKKKAASKKKTRGAGPLGDLLGAIGLGEDNIGLGEDNIEGGVGAFADARSIFGFGGCGGQMPSGAGPLSFIANAIGLGEDEMASGGISLAEARRRVAKASMASMAKKAASKKTPRSRLLGTS